MSKPSLFRVSGFGLPQATEFMAKGAQLPGETIGVIEVAFMGRIIKLPGDRRYQDFTITFYNDTSFEVKRALEAWTTEINSEVGNIGGYPVVTKRDGQVEQLDVDGGVLATYKLIGAFPTEIAQIDLDFGNADAVEEYTVTLAYDYHEKD